MFSQDDHRWMSRALELARRGIYTTAPNPSVGCVLVNEGEVVGEGYHQRAGEPHAEVHALRAAGELARGATAYVTLEPCSHYGRTPPCANALIEAGVARVVAAMVDPNPQVGGRGLRLLAEAGIETAHGLLAAEAEALNPGFFKRMRTGFPRVTLKMGASLDGRTAMASGESQWITSPEARRDVQRLRARHDAVLSTATTVLADDASLTVRWDELPESVKAVYPIDRLRQPVRVLVDSKNRLTPAQSLFGTGGEVWLARHTADGTWPASVRETLVPRLGEGLDLVSLFMVLARQNINSVLVEAGASLAGALINAGLVDELVLYQAPKLLGDAGRGLCHLPGLEKLSRAPRLELTDVRRVGPDIRITAKVV
ncbi:bifunctional diaminohydroxyphosphoribosylaminopyrimidine deaminase/5-amino-6-(5-phosphoribosylamino)uracil reductase RibD [Aeromonas schubertii]|uniref:bifunctional diaminohydroxyphosphoribosylaminopyrimidine deaminase/5-amino-6-(5-phosphoribosylamino)uracil reductase RibD n=1 Tax=Aeromonas schubertii TaxID=652 RepID=UPI0010A76BD9|nr:bifunctional diaminohydroxyphosphoribosylaminopyrimidine deaminase/5-amino-6-(5-phosphoribosylamino)uracil reductase RibD [Aeromonas schubertii]QCG47338.1 bifunctional diaminohydroxyphosphoribosylaminopyrimidine deaminase/5-amino-6-(5-phosphoribosylamino)uracil reductase RibD [Aeromonas schubertii]